MSHDAEIAGAIEMARYWVRNPGRMVGFEQVCRELYTVSLALSRVAGQAENVQADAPRVEATDLSTERS